MESVTRSWLVWQLTGSPFWLGFMVFWHWFPVTALSLFAGVLADRVDNRKLIFFCEFLYLISALGMGILTVAGIINIWEIAGLLMLHGLSGAISNPSRQVFIHDMVGKEKLMSAVSLNNSLFQSMQFVGPALAGTLVAAVGPGPTYLINTFAFVPAIITLATIRVRKEHVQSSQVSAWESSAEGLRHVRDKPLLLSLVAMATLPALLVGDSVSAMMPIFATRVLNVGAQGMGFLLSANGLGALMASLALSYLGSLRHKGLLIVFATLAYAAFLVVFSASSWYLLSLFILMGVGMAAVGSSILVNTSLQLAASDTLRGRVMGVYTLGTLGVRSFNGPLIGGFASAVGAPMALGILGGLIAVAILTLTTLSPEGRRLD